VHAEAGAPDTLTFAVPDSMPREQLSLLLGVAQACDFTVAGLVSRSVLLGSRAMGEHGTGRALHVEAQLNQTIVNELQEEDGELHLLRSTPLPACGLMALQERAVGAIASAFIQQTRFDPRRSASSEQALYNQLQMILATVRERGEASVDVDGHRCRITASALAGSSQRLLDGVDQVRDGRNLPLLLDPELATLPGVDGLAEALTLRAGLLWEAWQEQQGKVELGEDEVHLIDRLPLLGSAGSTGVAGSAPTVSPAPPPASAGAPDVAAAASTATHLLLGVRALPLRGKAIDLGHGFELRRDGAAWTVHGDGALINGLPATPVQPLVLGDTLSLGTAGHGRLIEVVE